MNEPVEMLERLSQRPGSGVRLADGVAAGERRFSINFRIFRASDDCLELGPLWHGGMVRSIPGAPRLHVESTWIRADRPGAREHLVWLVYLRPEPRSAKVLEFRPQRLIVDSPSGD